MRRSISTVSEGSFRGGHYTAKVKCACCGQSMAGFGFLCRACSRPSPRPDSRVSWYLALTPRGLLALFLGAVIVSLVAVYALATFLSH